jgi:hypothetical protein
MIPPPILHPADAGEHTLKSIETRAIRSVRTLRESVAVKPLI